MLIESMIKTMHAANGIGLAAPQIGINKKILVADVGKGPMVMVNPDIYEASKNQKFMEEGCLSLPTINVDVKRSRSIKVRYLNVFGEMCDDTFHDLMARVVLHENDHLNGRLIIDYANDKMMKKMEPVLKRMAAGDIPVEKDPPK